MGSDVNELEFKEEEEVEDGNEEEDKEEGTIDEDETNPRPITISFVSPEFQSSTV